MRVLGIDPGLRITGYGCVEARGMDFALVEAGVIRLMRPGAKPPSVADRLVELHTDIAAAFERLNPDAVAVEAVFAHSKHPATAIAMSHARGVILLAVRAAGIRLLELKPTAVKRFLTGHGHAAKDQMQEAVRSRLGLQDRPEPPDVADAIAIAMCAASRAAGLLESH